MFNTILSIAVAVIFLVCSGCVKQTSPSKEPPQTMVTYYSHGQFDHEVSNVTQAIRRHIDSITKTHTKDKLAVVFDFDDTLVSNYPAYEMMNFEFKSNYWRYWINQSKAPAIPSMQTLYDYILQKGITIFIVTSRREKLRPQTVKNLTNSGYAGWTYVFMKSKWMEELNAQEFKNRIRKQLTEQDGYLIIANIGDQQSDLAGGYALKTFKIPNYLYLVK